MISGFIGDVVGQYHIMILPVFPALTFYEILIDFIAAFPVGLRDGWDLAGGFGSVRSEFELEENVL